MVYCIEEMIVFAVVIKLLLRTSICGSTAYRTAYRTAYFLFLFKNLNRSICNWSLVNRRNCLYRLFEQNDKVGYSQTKISLGKDQKRWAVLIYFF